MNLEAVQLNAGPGLQQSALPSNPFVGLRPFKSQESVLFFGRDKQTVELLQQLHRTRFLAVVGSSGCGKSSLIYAGLIPKLKAGFLVERRERWEIIALKPGDSPLRNLAAAALGAVSHAPPSEESVAAFVKKMRVEGAEAIAGHISARLDEAGANLLLLVDQFEEIFRFVIPANVGGWQEDAEGDEAARAASLGRRSDEAARFVSILVELSRQRTLPAYVVMTMRSDFIGDYDLFNGLPEAVNGNLYLVPRLDRQQYQNAVKGPVGLYGRKTTPRLLDRVVNDLGGEVDQLPVMQHAMMRTWENWSKRGEDGPLDLPQYEAAGTIKNALSWDADKALTEVGEAEVGVAERLFQALVETDVHGRRVRRPARLSEIQQITGAAAEVVLRVIECFRRDGRCFLVLSSERVEDDPVIDISHESLIRQWDRLREWVDAEKESREIYMRVADAALRQEAGRGRLWGEDDPDLQQALDWWAKRKPNAAWAARYHPAFDLAADFLKKSEEKREADKAERERQRLEELESEKIRRQNSRLRRFTFALVFISLLAAVGFGASVYNYKQARSSEAQATLNASQAEKARELERQAGKRLLLSLQDAEDARREAEKQTEFAKTEGARASKQQRIAEAKAAEALRAKEALRIATDGREKAIIAAQNEARRKLLGELGSLYQQAISLSGSSDTTAEAAQKYEEIYRLYDQDDVRAGKITTLLVLGRLHDDPVSADGEDDLKALGYYERALALFDLNNSAERNEVISTLIKTGDLLANFDDRKESVKAAERYEQALKLGYTPSVGDDREIYRKLGYIYGTSQEPDKMRTAIKYYEQAVRDLDAKVAAGKETPDDSLKKMAILIALGTLNSRLGRRPEAEKWHNAAVELARAADDDEIGALIDIGLSFNLPGEQQARAEYFDRAIKKGATDSKDPEAAADALIQIGLGLINEGNNEAAIQFLKRAEERSLMAGGSRKTEANAIRYLARAYSRLKRRQEALEHYRRALTIYEEIGEKGEAANMAIIIKRLEDELKSVKPEK